MAYQEALYRYVVRVDVPEDGHHAVAPKVSIQRHRLPSADGGGARQKSSTKAAARKRRLRGAAATKGHRTVVERKVVASKMKNTLCRIVERELAKAIGNEMRIMQEFEPDHEAEDTWTDRMAKAVDLAIDTLISNLYQNLGVVYLVQGPATARSDAAAAAAAGALTTFHLDGHSGPNQYRYDWRLAFCDAHIQYRVLVFAAGTLKHDRSGVFDFSTLPAHLQTFGTIWRTGDGRPRVQGFRYGTNPPCPYCREFAKTVADCTLRDPAVADRGSEYVADQLVAAMRAKFRHIQTQKFCGRAEVVTSQIVAVYALAGTLLGFPLRAHERTLAVVVLALCVFLPQSRPCRSPFADVMQDDRQSLGLGEDVVVNKEKGVVVRDTGGTQQRSSAKKTEEKEAEEASAEWASDTDSSGSGADELECDLGSVCSEGFELV